MFATQSITCEREKQKMGKISSCCLQPSHQGTVGRDLVAIYYSLFPNTRCFNKFFLIAGNTTSVIENTASLMKNTASLMKNTTTGMMKNTTSDTENANSEEENMTSLMKNTTSDTENTNSEEENPTSVIENTTSVMKNTTTGMMKMIAHQENEALDLLNNLNLTRNQFNSCRKVIIMR